MEEKRERSSNKLFKMLCISTFSPRTFSGMSLYQCLRKSDSHYMLHILGFPSFLFPSVFFFYSLYYLFLFLSYFFASLMSLFPTVLPPLSLPSVLSLSSPFQFFLSSFSLSSPLSSNWQICWGRQRGRGASWPHVCRAWEGWIRASREGWEGRGVPKMERC